jgi:DNA-binding CsgD family transcriptional regulator
MVANLQNPLPLKRLSYRSATVTDLDRCFQVCGAPFAYDPSIRPHVPQVWRQLLQQNTLISSVIEAVTPGGREIVGFGAATFVTDEFIAAAKQRDRPYVREWFVRCILEGNSPVLSFADAQLANRQDGLNLFFFNDTLTSPQLSYEQLAWTYEKYGEALYELQACRMKELLWEFYGDFAIPWPKACGLHFRQDWHEFWQHHSDAMPPADQRPYLVGLTREESKSHYGTHSSYLFVHKPARYLFTASQQDLLRRAMNGETDEELGKSLHLSLSTVKKRWQAIYDRVGLLAPDILEEMVNESDNSNGNDLLMRKRGAEKRRYLLNYLRQHPEEIHPINAAEALH